MRVPWLICGLAILLAPATASAQSPVWPQHTVRLITPLGPGSGMDASARVFAERLSAKWGQPVVVENRQGADGILAVQSFLSDRDNHSLMFAFAGLLSINPLIHGDKLPYDVRDVVPVASAIDSTLALTVSDTLKLGTLADFVKAAKERPGQLNWAATTGLPLYVVAALQKSAGIDITQIAYRDFSPAFQDFATGRVQLLATGITLLLPQVQSGRGKFLMVTNSARSPLAPEVPTPAEAGFPELSFNGVNGIYGWRGMPESLKARIAADVREIANDPAVAERLKPTGSTMRPGNAAEFAAAIEEQRAKVAAVAEAVATKPK
ncbi:Bug family tripartite tricarboxylate transporter substrate binding protein [Rhodoplanes sp. Z2-YC6860]|uniref:Bug family tripartite tricarboxylate transporter substrate binding protein n=1 Tax=Rhodoplanes sp. Z2-YC6860 TaxID=674703 RepID=UPI00082ECDEF|nr:tripartite tricarboxylate transporter substrate binding protein [Rhodoplanes sp. Z2-YC6860]